MTTFDRAFMKAYSESKPRVASANREAAGPAHGTQHHPTASGAAQPMLATRGATTAQSPSSIRTAPLSTFAEAPHIDESSRALLEVDHLAWPEACDDLLARAPEAWDTFAAQLAERAALKKACVAIACSQPGDGCTTIALAMAKRLAADGVHTAIVDANFRNPTLARSCGIAIQTGWNDVLHGDLPLGEALVSATRDGVTLMPWRGGVSAMPEAAGSMRAGTMFGMLRNQFDAVLIDAGPLADADAAASFARFAQAVRLDGLYLVHDVRSGAAPQVETCAALRRAGLSVLGIIENFVSELPSLAGHSLSSHPASRELATIG
jgi:Mrp family chromosome partitioning ATPase